MSEGGLKMGFGLPVDELYDVFIKNFTKDFEEWVGDRVGSDFAGMSEIEKLDLKQTFLLQRLWTVMVENNQALAKQIVRS